MIHKGTLEMVKEGNLLSQYRKEIGMKSVDAAKLLNVCQGNYSHMEAGRQNINAERMAKMRNKFNEWKINRIEFLKSEITYLNSIK